MKIHVMIYSSSQTCGTWSSFWTQFTVIIWT